ncbi:unnamed protein product [Closterium sp. NIES-64]|nr:unnamed protein product [Closterium sp. NIES-64]
MGTAEPIGISPHWGTPWCGNRCGVLHRPIRVFVMWYGVFSDAQKQTLRTFVASLSPNADTAVTVPLWWNINRLYYDEDGNHISQSVMWGGEVEDRAYSKGKTMLKRDIEVLLGSAISSQQLPHDPRAVYFLLSDEFVNQCPTSCLPRDIRSDASLAPTGDAGMDGLVSVFAHELAEAASSPFVSTWFDGEGNENADKCSWKFTPLSTDTSGIKYNLPPTPSSKTTTPAAQKTEK